MKKEEKISQEYIQKICDLYGEVYDDRIEDSKPATAGLEKRIPGKDFVPGVKAKHKSLKAFQNELLENGIKLSTSKIKKILITGGCWSTERSREIASLYNLYTQRESETDESMTRDAAIKKIANELNVSIVTVDVNLPYKSVVYNLEDKSKNAIRCKRYKDSLVIDRNIDLPSGSSLDKLSKSDSISQLRELQKLYNGSISTINKSINPELQDRLRYYSDIMRRAIPAALSEISLLRDRFSEFISALKPAVESINLVLENIRDRYPSIKTIYKLANIQYVLWKDASEGFAEEVISCKNNKELLSFLSDCDDKYDSLSVSEPIELVRNYLGDDILFEQSISAYNNGHFILSIMGLMSLIDRVLSYYNSNKRDVSIVNRFNYLCSKINASSEVTLDIDEYNEMILFATLSKSLKIMDEFIKFSEAEPSTINRHWIMHGRTSREYTKIDCIRVIRILCGIILLNKMVEGNKNDEQV